MHDSSHSSLQKDVILRDALSQLKVRGLASAWGSANQPFSELYAECLLLASNPIFRRELASYLRVHTTVPRAVQMLFTSVAMSARAQWQDAPEAFRSVAARGWFLGRWIPTFLIIDGPIGRFMTADDSPLTGRYGPDYPLLTAAKDFLGERTFKLMRNGFAHWVFDWEVVGGDSFVVAYDPERDLPIVKLHQAEADAYHIAAFALVEALYGTMFEAS